MDRVNESEDNSNFPYIDFFKIQSSGSEKVSGYLDDLSLSYKSVSSYEFLNSHQYLGEPLTFFYICRANFTQVFSDLESIRDKNSSVLIILFCEDLELNQIQKIINKFSILRIATKKDELIEFFKKALEDQKKKKSYFRNIKKIKYQNEKLESLNKNLENIIHERTHKEFESHQMTLSSLKDMQALLKFIQIISRCESIDEIMNEVRRDLKKFHDLMSPILVFQDIYSQVKIFHFQGKQLIEKVESNLDLFFLQKEKDIKKMRTQLTQILGRPFGNIVLKDIIFRSNKLENMNAHIIYEHSFSSKNYKEFQRYSAQRWPIINMALENILLKEKFSEIAKQWAKTFSEIRDPIIIVDSDYKMTLSNKKYHIDSRRACYEAFARRKTPCLECPIGKTFSSGQSQSSNIHCLGKIYRVHSYPIRLKDERKVHHVINQYVDATESIDLQSRFIQGEKMAAVGLLAGNIAHELNNPLTGIHSLSSLLLEEIDEKTMTYKDLIEVRDATVRCQKIIKDFLEFSHIKETSNQKFVHVNDLINKTLPLLKTATRNQRCQISLSKEDMKVNFNPQLLQQVVFNLINNACQSMSDGGSLHIRSCLEGQSCQIFIKDTGPGISSEVEKFIFDPFFTTKAKGKGTGLGLSISRSIVESFNGTLTLNKNTQKGCEFKISLPRVG